ncbi:IS30 family transposase [Fusobacterium necrophorum subsp. funduliforme]
MKKNDYKERMFDLLGGNIDDMGFDEKMNFVSNIIIEFEKENEHLRDTSNKGKSWKDEELKIILTDAPTKYNCLKYAKIFKRGYGSIEQIYRWATTLVLTDRKSRLEIIRKLEAKTSAHVVKAVRDIITEYPGWIKTITSDNGSEFMNAAAIERLGIPYFYAHSYCSWERGSNENNNKLIRRYLPKGMDIGEVSEERIKEIEEWMNTYPRKLWNGKSSKEMHAEEFTTYLC